MDLNLNGRTALVTGGSSGIGFGIAQLLAAEGCNLILTSRSAANLDAARKRIIDRHNVGITTHALDLAEPENILTLANACRPVDILINNAGAIPGGHITEFSDKAIRDAWNLKVFGYINLTREIYRDMCERKRGVIVNIVGLGGERPSADRIAAGMGNAALLAMSRALGAESINYGVRVVAINPGSIETERQVMRLKARARKEFGDESRWRELISTMPSQRLGTVHEVAAMAVFLCSEHSSYISGTIINIDGGRGARY